jgi:hypothetical protein
MCVFLFITCAQDTMPWPRATKSCARDYKVVRSRYYVVALNQYVLRTKLLSGAHEIIHQSDCTIYEGCLESSYTSSFFIV